MTSSWAVSSSTLRDRAATSSSRRKTVGHSYQLAVVADDAAMGVNQVIRGDDLVPSTPRQILLYRQAGWPEPRFGHVSLAVEPDGRRLAKRDGSLKLATFARAGVDPRRSSAPRSFVRLDPEAIRRWPRARRSVCSTRSRSTADPWVVTREWLETHQRMVVAGYVPAPDVDQNRPAR